MAYSRTNFEDVSTYKQGLRIYALSNQFPVLLVVYPTLNLSVFNFIDELDK